MYFFNILLISYETQILRLIVKQVGDQFRLEDMLERCKAGKPLYKSDILYIQRLSPKVIEKPVVFTEEPYIHKEIPTIKNKRTFVIVLTIILVVISVAVAIVLFLIVFTNLIYFHGIPQEGFCDVSPGEFCIDRPYFQDFLQVHFEHIYHRIIELLT